MEDLFPAPDVKALGKLGSTKEVDSKEFMNPKYTKATERVQSLIEESRTVASLIYRKYRGNPPK